MVSLKPVNHAAFIRYLKSTESFRPTLYNPTGGSEEDFLTIGYGHKCRSKAEEDSYQDVSISEAKATELLEDDVASHTVRAQSVYDAFVVQSQAQNKRRWTTLSETERLMLVDIALNGGLQRFPKLMTAVADADYATASREHSRWWRDQKGAMHPLTDRNGKYEALFFLK